MQGYFGTNPTQAVIAASQRCNACSDLRLQPLKRLQCSWRLRVFTTVVFLILGESLHSLSLRQRLQTFLGKTCENGCFGQTNLLLSNATEVYLISILCVFPRTGYVQVGVMCVANWHTYSREQNCAIKLIFKRCIQSRQKWCKFAPPLDSTFEQTEPADWPNSCFIVAREMCAPRTCLATGQRVCVSLNGVEQCPPPGASHRLGARQLRVRNRRTSPFSLCSRTYKTCNMQVGDMQVGDGPVKCWCAGASDNRHHLFTLLDNKMHICCWSWTVQCARLE